MEKAQLLRAMQRCSHEWNTLLATLRSEELLLPGVAGTWSVKDVLGHLSAWMELTLANIAAAREGQAPVLIFETMSEEELEALNQRLYHQKRVQTLEEAQANFHATWHRLYEETAALDDNLLIETERLSHWQGKSLGELIYGEACEHMTDHTNALRSWIAARRGGSTET
ncbi:ClbS/DfsB family four-helix bundle protein [Thermogemmatispora onikobensis]|uniref:ClbS/DfsB family four-helix bundle protein n=1 Tax=Thermogemmatispora onikobensis TaxID=732234 RepID=UPI00114CF85E|nr:ClbS/DfsB family four-helix bundle protein [Thermogemmatispora onikobensis]